MCYLGCDYIDGWLYWLVISVTAVDDCKVCVVTADDSSVCRDSLCSWLPSGFVVLLLLFMVAVVSVVFTSLMDFRQYWEYV